MGQRNNEVKLGTLRGRHENSSKMKTKYKAYLIKWNTSTLFCVCSCKAHHDITHSALC